MIKTAAYNQFVEGFIKEAGDNGCDTDFLRGYIDQADEIVNIWKEAFDELAEKSGDPLYKVKLANELVYFTMRLPELEKKALDLSSISGGFQKMIGGMNTAGMSGMQNQLQNYATQHSQGNGMMSGMLKHLADALHNNPNMLSSLVSGGGAGGLIGLLLGVLTGHPMIGMAMGGLGGAGAGAYLGNSNFQNSINSSMSGKPAPTTPEQTTENNQILDSGAPRVPVSETEANNHFDPANTTRPESIAFPSPQKQLSNMAPAHIPDIGATPGLKPVSTNPKPLPLK